MIFFLLAFLNIAILTLLLIFSFYHYVVRLRWDESERLYMEEAELNLAHLLTMLDQQDTQAIMERNTDGRRFLFLEYSPEIKADIVRALKQRKLDLSLLFWSVVFFASYYLLRFKANLACARSDLRYLCGLGLVLLRRAELTGS